MLRRFTLFILFCLLSIIGVEAQTLTSGQTVNGRLETRDATGSRGYQDSYTFTARRNQQIEIVLTCTGFNGFLTLRPPSGRELTNDNDGSPARSRIATAAAAAGTYTVLVTSTARGAVGSYALLMTLDAPAATAAGRAIIAFCDGTVTIRRGGTRTETAAAGALVAAGDIVETQASSMCEITVETVGRVIVDENTSFRIETLSPSDGSRSAFFDVARGSVLCRIQSVATRALVAVRTPTAVLGVRGTEFVVRATAPNQSSVAVRQGTVVVLPPGVPLVRLNTAFSSNALAWNRTVAALFRRAPSVTSRRELQVTDAMVRQTADDIDDIEGVLDSWEDGDINLNRAATLFEDELDDFVEDIDEYVDEPDDWDAEDFEEYGEFEEFEDEYAEEYGWDDSEDFEELYDDVDEYEFDSVDDYSSFEEDTSATTDDAWDTEDPSSDPGSDDTSYDPGSDDTSYEE